MNFADIETAWHSPHNRPTPAQLEKQKMELQTELNRRQRSARGLVIFTAIPLAAITVLIVSHLVWPNQGTDRIDLPREWAIVPFFLLPWVGWAAMWRLHRGHLSRHADYARSIQASVAALLDDNRRERLRTGVIGGLLLASLPLIGGVVWQLRAVGKAGDEILIPAFVLYPTYVVLMLAGMAFKYVRTLVPRGRELQGLLAQYRTD